MPSFSIQLAEGISGYAITSGDVTNTYAIRPLTSLITSTKEWLKKVSAYYTNSAGAPQCGKIQFIISTAGVSHVIHDDHQIGGSRIIWEGNMPIPKNSIIQVRIDGNTHTMVAGNLLYAEGIING